MWSTRKQASGEFPSLAPLSTVLTPTPELVRTGPRAGRGAHSHPPEGPRRGPRQRPAKGAGIQRLGRRVVFSSVYLSRIGFGWRAITSLPPPALVRKFIGHIVPLVVAVTLDVSDP